MNSSRRRGRSGPPLGCGRRCVPAAPPSSLSRLLAQATANTRKDEIPGCDSARLLRLAGAGTKSMSQVGIRSHGLDLSGSACRMVAVFPREPVYQGTGPGTRSLLNALYLTDLTAALTRPEGERNASFSVNRSRAFSRT